MRDLYVAMSLYASVGASCSIAWGAHRYFAHRTFKVSRSTQFLIALWGTLAWSGSPLGWAAKHRKHHKNSDIPGKDPELDWGEKGILPFFGRGLFWVHEWWTPENNWEGNFWLRDYHKFPELRFVHGHFLEIQVATVLTVWGLLGWPAAWYFVCMPPMLWMVQSCGFFANAHAEGRSVYMKYCSFGFTARLVSDEPNHTLHHKYPYHAYSQPYQLFGITLELGKRLGVVHSFHKLGDAPAALEDARELQRTHKTMDFESDFGVPFWWASQIFGHGLTVYYVLQSQNWFFRISTLGIYFLYPWIRAGDSLEID
jgi:fatty-acid desaturase